MGVIFVTLISIVGLLGAAFSKILAEEFRAWAPTVARSILEAAVQRLPDEDRERYREEWSSHINDTPGDIGKILAAVGTNVAAWKMTGADQDYPRLNRSRLIPKRALDIVMSLSAILIFLPAFPVLAVLVRLSGRGPILFRQRRVGKDGKIIEVFKLRTLALDGRSNRVSWVGAFLRKSNIDELPQLFNILKGDMSFVGPRPSFLASDHPETWGEKESKARSDRLKVRPGLVGLAQLLDRNFHVEKREKMRLEADLQYIKNYSFLLDIKILLRTLKHELFGTRRD